MMTKPYYGKYPEKLWKRFMARHNFPELIEKLSSSEDIDQKAERYKLLEKRGIILADILQERFVQLGIIPWKGEYFLEDILKFIPILNHPTFFKMFYDFKGNAVVLLDDGNRLPSEELRASSNTFVNAAGKFIIEAIERGFVKSDWMSLLLSGTQYSEYQISSNLFLERNWILTTFQKMILKDKPSLLFRIKNYLKL